ERYGWSREPFGRVFRPLSSTAKINLCCEGGGRVPVIRTSVLTKATLGALGVSSLDDRLGISFPVTKLSFYRPASEPFTLLLANSFVVGGDVGNHHKERLNRRGPQQIGRGPASSPLRVAFTNHLDSCGN